MYGVCSHVIVLGLSVSVLVPSVVCAVVALTVIRVLLFMREVSMLIECDGDGNAGVGVGECMGGICGSGVVLIQETMKEMSVSVVRGVRGIGGVYEMCLCLTRG